MTPKKILTLSLLFLFVNSFSQPNIAWTKCYGGSSAEQFSQIVLSKTNDIYFVGSTDSNDGNVSGNHGYSDVWVGKITNTGILQWQKCLGGSSYDDGNAIDICSDGSIVVAGQTMSNDGDVNDHIASYDFWVVKLDSLGVIQWKKCYGGYSADIAYSIKQTNDRGYIVGGCTSSNEFNVSGNHGGDDCWIVKLDSIGNIEWQKCFGGSLRDWANDICQVNDGYIILSFSMSNDGNVTGNLGDYDYWFVKINFNGDIMWQKSYGGSNLDQGDEIIATTDNGCVAVGRTFSNDGNVTNNTGDYDYWVVRLDSLGNLEWQKCFGYAPGNYNDHAHSIYPSKDGWFLIAGISSAFYGSKTCFDYWDLLVLKINPSGSLLWKQCLGGTDGDFGYSIIQDSSGNVFVAGKTESNNGNISGNYGWYDSWLVKIEDPIVNVISVSKQFIHLYPNPADNKVTIAVSYTHLTLPTKRIV